MPFGVQSLIPSLGYIETSIDSGEVSNAFRRSVPYSLNDSLLKAKPEKDCLQCLSAFSPLFPSN